MIVIRYVHGFEIPADVGWDSEESALWVVEFYCASDLHFDADSLYDFPRPYGTAWVRSGSGDRLNYIEVEKSWRRRGVGKALLAACVQFWGDDLYGLDYATASEEGEKLLDYFATAYNAGHAGKFLVGFGPITVVGPEGRLSVQTYQEYLEMENAFYELTPRERRLRKERLDAAHRAANDWADASAAPPLVHVDMGGPDLDMIETGDILQHIRMLPPSAIGVIGGPLTAAVPKGLVPDLDNLFKNAELPIINGLPHILLGDALECTDSPRQYYMVHQARYETDLAAARQEMANPETLDNHGRLDNVSPY
jgi:GNAT superfamily N-acetyltransferase